MYSLFTVLLQRIDNRFWSLFAIMGFWLLVLTGVFLAALYYIKSTLKLQRLRAGLPDIDRMGRNDFEDFVRSLLQAEGYWAEPRDPAVDGVNLLATDWRGGRIAVHARRFGDRERINKDSVMRLIEAKRRYGFDRVLIITNGRLTHWANEYARANLVETWDREVLRGFLVRGEMVRRGNLFRQTEYHKKRSRKK